LKNRSSATIIKRNTTPPMTPPAIAPACDFLLGGGEVSEGSEFDDVDVLEAVEDGAVLDGALVVDTIWSGSPARHVGKVEPEAAEALP
jgi:hypothetical protein